MSTRAVNMVFVVIFAAVVVAAIVAWPSLPDPMLAHWNAAGEPDGTMPRFWGVALVPLIMVFIGALYWFLPRIDPLRDNIDKFRRAWNLTFIAIYVFFAYLFGLILALNLGADFNMTMLILPAVSILFFVLGMILPMSRRNWFFGIRTPWTLSSDAVWEGTHRVGGALFKIAAGLTLVGLLFFDGTGAVIVLLVGLLGAALATVVYSYVLHRRLHPKP